MSAFVVPAQFTSGYSRQVIIDDSPPNRVEQLPSLDAVNIYGYTVPKSALRTNFGAIDLGEMQYNGTPSRTLVLGNGNIGAVAQNSHVVGLGGNAQNTPFLGYAMSKTPLPAGTSFMYIPDQQLQFDSISYSQPLDYSAPPSPGRFSGSSVVGSDIVAEKYDVTGKGVNVAIVDTGTDFSNPDMQHAVARDENNVPIMLDADGQGIVLTRAKYIANIDEKSGRILNYEGELPEGITSDVYVDENGVFLRTTKGTIPVYNSIYPFFGEPVLEGEANVDWKIGNNTQDYIKSKSGIYRMGVIYELHLLLGYLTIELVPVLVVDSNEAGVYDTIIPDMSFGWALRADDLADSNPELEYLRTEPTYDFTDEKPIKIGGGSEFLVYDHDKDGYPDYSIGTAGARVLDIWRVMDNKTSTIASDVGYGEQIEAKLLEPIDPAGEYFGIMYDYAGHGTSTAATVASKGEHFYSIYGDENRYQLAGMAPDAKIIPVKALWIGDTIYGWMYAAGFDLDDGKWKYTGDHRADIISNSWGISNFPLLKAGPGYDFLSMVSSLLVLPGVLDSQYEGTVVVGSIGNSGLGYGSVGSPNASPLAISVGATTNNVHVGYASFANITRFGSSAGAYDDVADFSSRGPSLLGDPKPEIMAIGSYGFTPAAVIIKNQEARPGNPRNEATFTLFGGTSMAAPMVAGVAALVIGDMKDRGESVDPFAVKSILMSSAKDLKNDPFVQGAGRIDAVSAIELARGSDGRFLVYTDDTVRNILSTMLPALSTYDVTKIVGDDYQPITEDYVDELNYRESRWFAGQIEQGKSSQTQITVENPTDNPIKVEVSGVVEKIIKTHQLENQTQLFEKDPTHDAVEFGYKPNYYNLTKLLGSPIPEDADLMVARLNFPFSSFMNSTELYGDYLRIASLYTYNWQDADKDGTIAYKEIAMVNRGGSWGTVQEVRVSDPAEKFADTPVVGVYPVPSIFSFWRGDRQINSTAMNYTLTLEFYKRLPDRNIAFDQGIVPQKAFLNIDPHSKQSIGVSILTDDKTIPGVHYAEIVAKSSSGQTVLMPVSYVVTSKQVTKQVPTLISPDTDKNQSSLMAPGYVGGLADMTSRYTAGDWRSYYFEVNDDSITNMDLEVSWPHNSTSISVMAFGPDGRIIATTVPSGVFEEFAGWPSNDWLGTTNVSEGGGFYFSQNNGDNSTLLQVPVNGTGTYSIMLHNTVFHGESLKEPVTVQAKFSTVIPDTKPPKIVAQVPEHITTSHSVTVTVEEDNPAALSYSIDGGQFISLAPADKYQVVLDGNSLSEGPHTLQFQTTDEIGYSAVLISEFDVDRTPPATEITLSHKDTRIEPGSVIGGTITADWSATDRNGLDGISVLIPTAKEQVRSEGDSSSDIDLTLLADGPYEISVTSKDTLGNSITKSVNFEVDNTAPTVLLEAPGSELKGKIKITLDAQDSHLKTATLAVGDKKTVDVTGLQSYELDTADLPDGKYDLKLVAADTVGNTATSSATILTANYRPQIESAAIFGILGGLAIGGVVAWIVASRRKRS